MYQVSTLQALALGYNEAVVTAEEVLKEGDTGLGTFEGVDGELYKIGSVEELKSAIQSLYNDTERIRQYTKACKEISYDSLQVYCEKLIEVYQV